MTEKLVFIVIPSPAGTQEQERLRKALQAEATSRGCEVRVFRVAPVRSADSRESGRKLWLIAPADAAAIYREAHRKQVAVFQFGSARIAPDPFQRPTSGNTISLEKYARYKAFHSMGIGTTPLKLLDEFDVWRSIQRCRDDRDPRVIPLHQFCPGADWNSLESADGEEQFAVRHGGPNHLRDESKRRWERPSPGAMHGREASYVAGLELRAGFHWDVQGSTNPSRMGAVVETWEFARGTYVNVAPDGTVRNGSGGRSARRRRPEPPRDAFTRSQRRNRRRG